MAEYETGRDFALRLDAEDALASRRELFYIKPGQIYMDGNSLGLCSKPAEQAVLRALEDWKKYGIGIWTGAEINYFLYFDRIAAKLARLIHARTEEVTVCASTTLNVHQCIATFWKPDARRYKIVVDELNFPTDRYAVTSQIRQRGMDVDEVLRVILGRDGKTLAMEDILAALTEDVSIVLLPSVLYRSAQLLDMAAITRAAHEKGIICGFDLCHSIGAVDHDMEAVDCDFAVWCNYKYLSGGPGAVLWCWLTGVLGISTKYAEGLLAVKYRIRTPQGKMLGGPMYALERGMGMKWLAVLFCIFTVCASFGIGNLVQSNAISMLCYETYRVPQALTGTAVAVCVALVVIFGVKGIARVCSAFVPLMAALYFLGCCYILWVNGGYVWDAVKLIVESAFRPEAAGGGFVGGSVIMTARYGIARGLFSNESGMGSAPIVAAAAQTRNPVRQALVSSTGTFWDTVVICALTGLVLVSSILAYPDISYADGPALTKVAFDKIPYLGAPLLTFGIVTFAFSTFAIRFL